MAVYKGADWIRVRIGLRVAHARKVTETYPDNARALLDDADSLVRQLPNGDREAWAAIVLGVRGRLPQ